jgi:hypothetical protein
MIQKDEPQRASHRELSTTNSVGDSIQHHCSFVSWITLRQKKRGDASFPKIKQTSDFSPRTLLLLRNPNPHGLLRRRADATEATNERETVRMV